MSLRIYQPTKNAMQSGKANTKFWLAEYDPEEQKVVEPLLGRTGSGDTPQQLCLKFPTKDDAIAYAEREGISYYVVEPKQRNVIIKTYADNFK